MTRNKKEYFEKKAVKLEVHLVGKSSDSNIISLDDLQNLIFGINGLSKYVIKKTLGKDVKTKLDKEAKEVCSLGVRNLKKGSAILDIEAFPDGQQKISHCINTESIMRETINLINNLEEDDKKVPIEVGPYLDNLTKPLSDEKANLEFTLYSDGSVLVKSKKLNFLSRERVLKILARRKLEGGLMYGLLKEINLKDYSSKVELFNKKLEKFFFEPQLWENIRDLLETNVEIKFEGKGFNKRMTEIKPIKSFQEKNKMTPKDLLESGVVGSLKSREDIKNSVEYANKLADDLLK